MSESPKRNRKRSTSPRKRTSRSGSHDKFKKDPDHFTQIYVAKIGKSTREAELKHAFDKYGQIREIALKHGYAFIDFETHDSAVRAIKEMDRKTLPSGEEIVVE